MASGRIIKRNQSFKAQPTEIPKAFLDTIICLDEAKVQEEAKEEQKRVEKELSTPKKLYELQKDEESNKWNVVNIDSGKPLNDEPMTKKKAEELLNSID